MDSIAMIFTTVWAAVLIGLILIGVWDLRKGRTCYGIVPIFTACFAVALYLIGKLM